MSNFSEKELKELEKLSRIDLTHDEELKLVENLKKILDHAEKLQEVDIEGVVSCNYVLQDLQSSVLRADETGPTLSREEFLSNAPDHVGGMVRVPPVIKPSA